MALRRRASIPNVDVVAAVTTSPTTRDGRCAEQTTTFSGVAERVAGRGEAA
jgi:hypothetical protein